MATLKQGFPQPTDGNTTWGADMRAALTKLDDAMLVQGVAVTNYLLTSGVYPVGTTQAQWTQLSTFIGPNNSLLFGAPVVAPTPVTPAPVEPVPSQYTTLSFDHFNKTYINASGAPISGGAPNTITSDIVSDYLTMAVLQRDQAKFDLVGDWANTNMRRGKIGSGQTIALDLLGREYTNDTGVVASYIINAGAELRRLGAYIRAWNLWGRVKDRDIASKIGSDIINRLVFIDEGRAYLVADEYQKNPTAHHTFNSAQWVKIAPGDINPVVFRLAKTFFGGTIWDQLVEGYYDVITRTTSNSGALATAHGLVPEQVAYDNASHGFSVVTNGVNGWTETATTDFTPRAMRAIQYLWADRKLYNEVRAYQALDRMIDFFVAEWGAGSNARLIKTQYTHAGVAVGSVVNDMTVYWYYRFLLLADTNTGGANDVLSFKRQADMATDGNGRYIPNQTVGTTAVSSRDGNLKVWTVNALDSGVFNDIGLLGSSPTSGTLLPIGGGTLPNNPDNGTVITPPTGTPNTTPPPVGTFVLYADPNSLMKNFANGIGDATAKARVNWAADTPQAYWSGIEWDNNCDGMKAYIDAATAKGQMAQVLSYSIPGRDLGQFSTGGAANRIAYEAWITKFALAIGTRRVVVAYEPDSLTHATELSTESRAGRMSIMKWAMAKIKAECPNAYLYVDVGHPAWKSVDEATALLREVGVEVADGFTVNVSNYRPDPECIAYGQAILGKLAMPNTRFVFDTGRNGNPVGPEGWDWANPIKRQYGRLPQFGNSGIPGCDGWMWWKRPGESDGNNYGPAGQAPPAGQFWNKFIYNFEVPDTNDLAGMSQRQPTPLVAGGGTGGPAGTGGTTGGGGGTPVNTTPITGGTGGSGLGGGTLNATSLSWYTYGTAPAGITLTAIKDVFVAKYAAWKTYVLSQSGMPGGMAGGAWRVRSPDENDGVTGNPNHTVSEGIGYGMLLTAYSARPGAPIFDSAAKGIFDGLWTYYKHFRKPNGLMNWKIDANGNVIGTGGATDGDLDVAMALVMMSRFYPGTASYKTDATALINAIRDFEFTPVNHPSGSNIMTNGDQWGFDSDRYMPDYLRPAYFREFAFHNNDTRWLDIVQVNYPKAVQYFYNNFPNTGYVPDQSNRAGQSIESIVPGSYKYGYNSVRMPFGLALDVVWNNNETAKLNLTRLANAERNRASQLPANTKAEGNLTGTAFGAYTNIAFNSGFGLAGIADSGTAAWSKSVIDWLNASSEASYFGQSLTCLALLVMTGEMKPYR